MRDVADIGHIIRDERKGLGLRQDELAAASGLGLRFLSDQEFKRIGEVLDRPAQV